MVFMCHIVTDLLGFDIKQAHLYSFNDFRSNLLLALSVYFDFLFNFFYIFRLIFLYPLQFFLDVVNQKIFILRILSQVREERVCNGLKIFFKLVK